MTRQRGHVRTLVVDDSPTALAAVCSFLENVSGIEVVATAKNSTEALANIKRLHPDLVLIDLELPGMNVVDLMTCIQGIAPGAKIVVVTIHDEPEIRLQCYAHGADAFVPKSYMDEKLVVEIRRLFPRKPKNNN